MKKALIIAIAALAVAVLLSPFASPSPDGLEKVAGDLGFARTETAVMKSSILPDYQFPGLGEKTATAAAGLAGTALTFILVAGIGKLIVKKDGVPH